MKPLMLHLACAVGLALACSGSARAQPGAPRPTFSPYLNLTRPGGTPALNYYGLVRPELQFRQSIQNLQGAVTANQQVIGNLQTGGTGVPTTGHPTQFLNYGGYFLNSGGTAAVGNYMGRPQTATRPALPTGPTLPPRRTR